MCITRRFAVISAFVLVVLLQIWQARAEEGGSTNNVSSLSPQEIEERIQHCDVVEALNAELHSSEEPSSNFTKRLFAVLFPSASPAINALLGTLYISGPPNLLLALCPPNIDPSSLSIMVAFAVGGLLGDTLFHLLPEIFLGEAAEDHVRFVLVEPNRNLLLGVAIMVGFMTFVAMDKTLRIATGGEGGHDHSHGQPSREKEGAKAVASGTDTPSRELRSRKQKGGKDKEYTAVAAELKEPEKISHTGLLNLIADFTHNITDGLAMASSFYASPTLGATTTLAVFCHEIPHEVGDFALLIQSGFSKRAAMLAQFGTAVGALLGTVIGIVVQEYGGGNKSAAASSGPGIMGTSLQWGDLLLPFTAGTFLYVGTVAVIPEMLETGKNKALEIRKTATQFAAVALGAGIMLVISWS